MAFVKPGPAEILRSSQKDDVIVKKIVVLLDTMVLTFGGPRISIKLKQKIQYLARLLYYSNTTLCNLQTLGEEYTGILQVDHSLRKIPSFMVRSAMIILDCFGAFMTKYLLSLVENEVKKNNGLVPEAKKKILNVFTILNKILPFINHLHKAYFYCHWGTYDLSKRITGINYVLIRFWLKDRQSLYGFKLLGAITFMNLIILALQSSKEFMNSRIGNSTEGSTICEWKSESKSAIGKDCVMCLNSIVSPSCTPCGHIFCWTCIFEWLNNDSKCPLCREIVIPSRVVQLMNYC